MSTNMSDRTLDTEISLSGASPFRDRHAVVTGATRGIGAEIATTLARLGADLTLMGRNEELLAEREKEINTVSGGAAFAVRAEVTDENSVKAAFAAAAEKFGPVSILVNNSGIAGSAPFHRMETDHWQAMLDTNLTGTFLCTRCAYPGMRENGWGRIVNVASTAGLWGYAYIAAYTASKHGVIGLTRALAIEAATVGVTVNAVCPGYTDTDMLRATVESVVSETGRSEEEAIGELTRMNPQGRLIQPAEVAETVAWLCLPSSRSINGQSIIIAGGELM